MLELLCLALIYLEKQNKNRQMAITNAQQKQLLNPPMKGNKRPGFQGGGAEMGAKYRWRTRKWT